jgi:hypothetical protein
MGSGPVSLRSSPTGFEQVSHIVLVPGPSDEILFIHEPLFSLETKVIVCFKTPERCPGKAV